MHVVWSSLDPLETSLEQGWITSWTHFRGTVVALRGGQPLTLQYAVEVAPDGYPVLAELSLADGLSRRLERSAEGEWRRDGQPASDLKGCTDVDIRLTPATNTLPIRRLGLTVGHKAEIQAVWIDIPSLELRVVRQRYTRTGERTYCYENLVSGYRNDLTVDEFGLVTLYPGAFERLA